MPQANQHKPTPPIEELRPLLYKYWNMGLPFRKMLEFLLDDIDTEKYGLSYSKLKLIMQQEGLPSARGSQHTLESITPVMLEIRERYTDNGTHDLKRILMTDFHMRVPRTLIVQWLNAFEPDGAAGRLRKRFYRRIFYCAGLNHIWAADQHDKWKRFGLFLHVGVELCSRKILWLKVWWTNSNPRLVCNFYLNAVEEYGGVPLLTQSDPGTENNGWANAQTAIRQYLDPTLVGTLQHKWMRSHNNIKPEIAWSQLRKRFSKGYERKFQEGVDSGLFNPNDDLHMLVFRWLAIPWLQAELDMYCYRFNQHAPRKNRHVSVPHGAPDLVFTKPHVFGVEDYKVLVPAPVIAAAREQWAPPNHPVFSLVPAEFHNIAQEIYNGLGAPPVMISSLWPIFSQLLQGCIGVYIHGAPVLPVILQQLQQMGEAVQADEIPLVEGQQEQEEEAGMQFVDVENGSDSDSSQLADSEVDELF